MVLTGLVNSEAFMALMKHTDYSRVRVVQVHSLRFIFALQWAGSAGQTPPTYRILSSYSCGREILNIASHVLGCLCNKSTMEQFFQPLVQPAVTSDAAGLPEPQTSMMLVIIRLLSILYNYFYFVLYYYFSLCCQCGTLIEPNSANMCVACLRTQVDITEGIPKQSQLYFCKNCERYIYIK